MRSTRTDELIPLSNVVRIEETSGALQLSRFNRLRSVEISADLAPRLHDGRGRAVVPGHGGEGAAGRATLTGTASRASSRAPASSSISRSCSRSRSCILVLAAQFESFVHPVIIMVTVPLALLGAVFGLKLYGLTINIFSQIAVIMLIGIAAKNGVLIVEFANQLRDRGLEFIDAVVQAAVTRLRPVLMTSLCTAFGALPLLLATGAGVGAAPADRHRGVLRHDRCGVPHAVRRADGVRDPRAQDALAAAREPPRRPPDERRLGRAGRRRSPRQPPRLDPSRFAPA